jgi:hypothetical protein
LIDPHRFAIPLTTGGYRHHTHPYEVGPRSLQTPTDPQYCLRVLVSTPQTGLQVPPFLDWTVPLLLSAEKYQANIVGIRHPFTYITVRHGPITTYGDQTWHVDGFSMRYHHLPEANYVWVQGTPTLWADQLFHIPETFSPHRHNLHSFLARRVEPSRVKSLLPGHQYLLDPYVVHRRPDCTQPRTLVRISFTPIEIPDIHNTRNPLIPTPHYTYDGVAARDALLDFDAL